MVVPVYLRQKQQECQSSSPKYERENSLCAMIRERVLSNNGPDALRSYNNVRLDLLPILERQLHPSLLIQIHESHESFLEADDPLGHAGDEGLLEARAQDAGGLEVDREGGGRGGTDELARQTVPEERKKGETLSWSVRKNRKEMRE